ncbi:hypothetical protein WJX82_000936 [Trebouxia sp. C0006]
MGFTASGADAGLFTTQYKGSNIYILVYVDDILVAAKNLADINFIKEHLATELVRKHGLKEGRIKSVPVSTSIWLVQAEKDQLLDREEYHYSMGVA